MLGEALTEPDARSRMFLDWDKVNRAGILFRLLSIFLEDLPQLVIQGVAAARSNEAVSPIAVVSISLTAMYAALACLFLFLVLHNNDNAGILSRSFLLGIAGEIARRFVDRINVEVRFNVLARATLAARRRSCLVHSKVRSVLQQNVTLPQASTDGFAS